MNAGLLYSALLILGGIVGYIKAGSLISLVAGSSAGSLCMLASLKARKAQSGIRTLIVVTLICCIFFAKRLMVSNQMFPSGFMTVCSLAVAVLALRASSRP